MYKIGDIVQFKENGAKAEVLEVHESLQKYKVIYLDNGIPGYSNGEGFLTFNNTSKCFTASENYLNIKTIKGWKSRVLEFLGLS